MTVPRGLNDLNILRARLIVGASNVIIAGIGLAQLCLNVVGYLLLPASFINKYGPFMRFRFPAMSVATVLLLVPLAYGGIQLLRHNGHSTVVSNTVFAAEIVYFIVFLSTWSGALSPFKLALILPGLFNAGLALQLATAYPVFGLILLNIQSLSRWGSSMTSG